MVIKTTRLLYTAICALAVLLLPAPHDAHSGVLPSTAGPQPTLIVQNGHGSKVISLGFRPDGRTLATGGADRITKLWDVATGRLLANLVDPDASGFVYSLAFTPDGRTVVTACSQTVIFLDIETARPRNGTVSK